MAHGGQNHGVHGKPCLSGIGLVDAGSGGGQIKDLYNGAALRACIPAVPAADVIRRDAPLLVGGAGQCDQGVLTGDKMLHLHRVAYGINIRHGGFHPVIDQDATLETQRQTGLPGKTGVRRNADRQHHHVGMEGRFVFQKHIHAKLLFRKALHRVAQSQFHAVLSYLTMDESGHVRIKGVHQLLGPLDDGDIHPQLPQVFRQLQTDETAACQHSGLRLLLLNVLFDAEGVFHGTQGKDFFRTKAGEPGLRRFGAGGKKKLVIAFFKQFPGLKIFHGNGFPLRVDSGNLMAHLHGNTEPGEKALRGLEGQHLRVFNDPTDIIGQAAVGIGNIARPLKHHDLCLLIQSADAGRGGGTARYAAYDNNLHLNAPPFPSRR